MTEQPPSYAEGVEFQRAPSSWDIYCDKAEVKPEIQRDLQSAIMSFCFWMILEV